MPSPSRQSNLLGAWTCVACLCFASALAPAQPDTPQPKADEAAVPPAGKAPGQLRWLRYDGGDAEDRGTAHVGETVTRVLRFSNTSAQRLRLRVISTSCGCVGAKFDKEELAPGGTTILTVAANVSPSTGKQSQAVRFEVDDGTTKQRGVCAIRYEADIGYEVLTRRIRRTFVVGEPSTINVWFRWMDAGDVEQQEFSDIEMTVPGFRLKGAYSPGEPSGALALAFEGTPKEPGTLTGSFGAKLSPSAEPTGAVPIAARVLPAWRAEPPGFVLSGAEARLTSELFPRRPGATPPAPGAVAMTDPDSPLRVLLAKGTDNVPPRVVLEWKSGSKPASPGSDRVIVKDEQGTTLVDLPISWFPASR